ncbi:MAG: hypothetical protein MHM6MM_006330 [Cercozoa sp. M6MM]
MRARKVPQAWISASRREYNRRSFNFFGVGGDSGRGQKNFDKNECGEPDQGDFARRNSVGAHCYESSSLQFDSDDEDEDVPADFQEAETEDDIFLDVAADFELSAFTLPNEASAPSFQVVTAADVRVPKHSFSSVKRALLVTLC